MCNVIVANQIRWNFRWSHFSWATLTCTADARWRSFAAVGVEWREEPTSLSSCCWRHSWARAQTADCYRRTVGDDDASGASCSVAGWSHGWSASDNCSHWSFRSSAHAADAQRAGDADGRWWTSLATLAERRFRRAVGAWGAMGEVLDIFTVFKIRIVWDYKRWWFEFEKLLLFKLIKNVHKNKTKTRKKTFHNSRDSIESSPDDLPSLWRSQTSSVVFPLPLLPLVATSGARDCGCWREYGRLEGVLL